MTEVLIASDLTEQLVDLQPLAEFDTPEEYLSIWEIAREISPDYPASYSAKWLTEDMHHRVGELAESDDPWFEGDHLASIIDRFHRLTADDEHKVRVIDTQAFETAMNKLTDHPETRAELLSRNLRANLLDGWRPVSSREKDLLDSWSEELSGVDPTLELRIREIEKADGVKYIGDESTGKIKRITRFAGRLLSQGYVGSDYLCW